MKRFLASGRSVRLAALAGFASMLLPSASPLAAQTMPQPTYWFCLAQVNSMGADWGLTEVAELRAGISRSLPEREFKKWVEEFMRGRIDIGLSRPEILSGSCRGFTTRSSAQAALDEHHQWRGGRLHRLPSLFRADGRIAWPGRDMAAFDSPNQRPATVATKEATSAKPVPSTVEARPVDAREAERAKRRAEFEAKVAEHQRQVAEHQRALEEREKAIAAENTRAEAAKKAAAAKLAAHAQALADHNARVAQMERDAAAARAEWATRTAAASGAPGKVQQVVTRQVKSLMLHNSEDAALKSLLENNGARNGPNWAPITNIRCSTVMDLGKQKWICTGEQARAQTPTTASGQ